MKTIEEKARAYDEALKVLHKYDGANIMFSQSLKEEMFPELKESEDEKIRKALIKYFSEGIEYLSLIPYNKEQCVAWLEKQSEQKPVDKPKFKVGDWVVTDMNNIVQIKAVNNGYYTIDNGGDFNMYYIDKFWHLWTIEDAKDGDVLVGGLQIFLFKKMSTSNSFYAHCNYHFIGYDSLSVYNCSYSIDNIHPATKEQRSLLFKKIKEAGYEWDAEKKELKKIIGEKQSKKNLQDNSFRRMFERKPAWNEEDEQMLEKCINVASGYYYLLEDRQSMKDWLKSLKDRVQPKQDEQKPKFRVGDTIKCKYDDRQFTIKSVDLDKGIYTYTQEGCGNDIDYADEDFELVKQKSADQPKFKVGDWITNGEFTWYIKKVGNNFYDLESPDGRVVDDTISHVDEHFHSFTIEDAKDGDVLFQDLMGGKTFIYNGINPDMAILYSFIISNDGEDVLPYHIGKPNTGIGYIEENKNIIHPATKKQRDLLFQKLKEAGYEWDINKKELKKIEHKSSWNEEDSPYYDDICEILINLLHSKTTDINKDAIKKDLDWLISIENRYTWKPDDKQMGALANACDGKILNLDYLNSLYQDLKKLREK